MATTATTLGQPVRTERFFGMLAVLLLTDVVSYSSFGNRIYAATVAGYPGEKVPGPAFALPPSSLLRTGR